MTRPDPGPAARSGEAEPDRPAARSGEPVAAVHVVLPGDIDDPAAPSGGNRYDRRVCQGLAAMGWLVTEIAVPGDWPRADATAHAALARALAALPDGARVLLDGLVACASPDVLAGAAGRLRLAVLVHLPLGDETGLPADAAAELEARERRTLQAAAAVVATSGWTARRLIDHHGVPAARVHVAAPGVDAAAPATGTDPGSRLLCVATVTPRKGQDVLVEALATLTDQAWECELVGALDRAPDFTERLRRAVAGHGLTDRVRLLGPRVPTELAESYAATDLLVLPSHAEPYGMVVTEALARGIPVLASAVDGIPEALGHAPDGDLPGLLVPAGDPAALAGALRRWLGETDLRQRLRRAAHARRATLADWGATTATLAGVLARLDRPAEQCPPDTWRQR